MKLIPVNEPLPSIESGEIQGRFFSTVLDVRICSVLKENADGIEVSELGRRVQRCLLVRVLEEYQNSIHTLSHVYSRLRMVIF